MVRVVLGDLTNLACDAIVNPANSLGVMGGGVALAIKQAGGEGIEQEAMGRAPIPVGTAVATAAGRLPCTWVIHAPTMEKPAQKVGIGNVRKAVRAALQLAGSLGVRTIAFPGMGTGVGGVPPERAAKAMAEEMKGSVLDITLVARDQLLRRAFQHAAKA